MAEFTNQEMMEAMMDGLSALARELTGKGLIYRLRNRDGGECLCGGYETKATLTARSDREVQAGTEVPPDPVPESFPMRSGEPNAPHAPVASTS